MLRRLTLASPLLIACASCGQAPIRNELIADAGVDAGDATMDASVHFSIDSPVMSPTDAADLSGPCVDDGQCNDGVACTFDQCDQSVHRCLNTPDNTQCDDGIYCDGYEVCVLNHGCESGPPETCEDGNECTTDACVEATKSCSHLPRDLDGDGDPDDHCDPGHDCNDLDPTVASTLPEICANNKDDNCNGLIDETPCVSATSTSCASALAITGAGSIPMSTIGAMDMYATSCSVSTPATARQVILAVTIPGSATQDLEVWATSDDDEVALAIQSACGDPTSEIACESAAAATGMRAIGRALSPGTYFVVVTTVGETAIDVTIELSTPTPKPTNETCSNAAPLVTGVPIVVSIIDPSKDLASACLAETGELTYSFTIASPQDVNIYSSTLAGSGTPVVGLRDAVCVAVTDEIACRMNGNTLFERDLAEGTYIVTVAGTSPIDANLLVTLSTPSVAPVDQTCASATPIVVGVDEPIDLSNHEDAIKGTCAMSLPDAARDLTLTNPSDVLVLAQFPENEYGSVAITDASCATNFSCNLDDTPVRAAKQNLPAGDYRIVIADEAGELDQLTAFVRPAVAPVLVSGAMGCATTTTIPETGGFFTGDTGGIPPSFPLGCDSSNAAASGPPEQIMKFETTAMHRVVFDMSGSIYSTILDVFSGDTCPGTEYMNGCYVGFEGERSFLDMMLPAGTYWIVVGGFDGAAGQWNLNVFVL